ncbi:MAG TPA: hypothetical protein V6C81_23970 [Planktothrix sp.]|jgi:hypothetical protein
MQRSKPSWIMLSAFICLVCVISGLFTGAQAGYRGFAITSAILLTAGLMGVLFCFSCRKANRNYLSTLGTILFVSFVALCMLEGSKDSLKLSISSAFSACIFPLENLETSPAQQAAIAARHKENADQSHAILRFLDNF